MEGRVEALAEEAIRALSRRDVPTAQMIVARAYELDRGLAPLVDAVNVACAEIDSEGEVSTATWNGLADVVPSTALQAVVEASRR